MKFGSLLSELKVDLVAEQYSSGGDIAFYEGDAMFDFTLTKGTFLS